MLPHVKSVDSFTTLMMDREITSINDLMIMIETCLKDRRHVESMIEEFGNQRIAAADGKRNLEKINVSAS